MCDSDDSVVGFTATCHPQTESDNYGVWEWSGQGCPGESTARLQPGLLSAKPLPQEQLFITLW